MNATVGDLSTAYWQLTEIAKALAQDAQVLILDEPTASLARTEADALFALIGRLTARGISIVYISHRMDEVYRIADRITILRDGRRAVHPAARRGDAGRDRRGHRRPAGRGALAYRERESSGGTEVLLEAIDLYAGPRVRGVSFELRAGEILGIAGLMGSGRYRARPLPVRHRPDRLRVSCGSAAAGSTSATRGTRIGPGSR